MSDKKKTTAAQERRITAYPSPVVYNLIEDYRVKNGFTRSEAVEYIARQFFGTIPPDTTNLSKSRNHY